MEFAKSLADPQKRCAALAEVAANQSDLEGPDAAAKTFDLALEAAETIADPYAKSYAMGEVAKRFSAAGLHAKAHELLDQAEHLAEKVPQPDLRAEALENIRTLKTANCPSHPSRLRMAAAGRTGYNGGVFRQPLCL